MSDSIRMTTTDGRAVRRFDRELSRFIRAMETTLRGAPIDAAAQLREKMIQCLKTLRQYDVSDRWGLLSQTEYENRVIAECGGLLLQEDAGKGEDNDERTTMPPV